MISDRSAEDLMQESVDRLRRIETRFTRFLEDSGFETKVRRPVWNLNGTIDVPSPNISLKDVIGVIPRSWPSGESVTILHKREVLCRINVD